MSDPYQNALDQLVSHGLLVQHLEIDGRTHRCRVEGEGRERRGWYLLHEWPTAEGERLIVGSFGIWRGTDPGTQKLKISRANELTADERAALRDRLAADRKRARAAREQEAARAARRAARVWAKAAVEPPAEGCVYLTKKQVHAYGLRYTENGALVIPIADMRGTLHGLQFILPPDHPHRRKLGRDKTYWPAGLQVSGRCHVIGNPAMSSVTLVAEGYATAASLHEATGLPVAVAFSANNLAPVAKALQAQHRHARILICADDDYLTNGNPGISAARSAALAVGGDWIAPLFPGDRQGSKLTDFNDLALFPDGGLALVREQVQAKLDVLGWNQGAAAPDRSQGGGDRSLKPLLSLDEAADRYSLIYGGKATLFDHWEHCLVPKSDVLDVLPDHGWRDLKLRSDRKVVRMSEVGFDPGERDSTIRCNLWGGWPTVPKAGDCQALLDLLEHLCSSESDPQIVFDWVLRWLAYPIQHPGAKMKTALIFHGAQGIGKNLFFEAYMSIYGEYGRVIDQSAIEDKFNDWASRKLFLVADEVVARMELYHLKNKLKALVTGDSIRINPKNVTPHDERNCVNLVFLSNERQPIVLERDDRRYTVIWCPTKLDQKVYDLVGECIQNGGVSALHDYLRELPLGDFKPWTAPPPTRARGELIEVSLESTERFVNEWQGGELEWPFGACASMDLYAAYRRWCSVNGVARPRESNHFLGWINKMPGWAVRPMHVHQSPDYVSGTRSQKMVLPHEGLLQDHGQARAADQSVARWATDQFFRFRNAISSETF